MHMLIGFTKDFLVLPGNEDQILMVLNFFFENLNFYKPKYIILVFDPDMFSDIGSREVF